MNPGVKTFGQLLYYISISAIVALVRRRLTQGYFSYLSLTEPRLLQIDHARLSDARASLLVATAVYALLAVVLHHTAMRVDVADGHVLAVTHELEMATGAGVYVQNDGRERSGGAGVPDSEERNEIGGIRGNGLVL